MFSPSKRKVVEIKSNNIFSPFLNTSKFSINIDDKHFNTLTHYYYYLLLENNKDMQNQLLKCSCAEKAQSILGSRNYSIIINPAVHVKTYSFEKLYKLMLIGTTEKLRQNIILKALLSRTDDSYIKYVTTDDSYLGTGPDGEGLNIMGIILMVIRLNLNKGYGRHRSFVDECVSKLKHRVRALELSPSNKFLISLPTIYETAEETLQ